MAIILLLLLRSAFSTLGHPGPFFKTEGKIVTLECAKKTCNNLKGVIVSVRDDDDNAKLAQILQNQQKAWIGLVCNNSRYKWSDGSNFTFNLSADCEKTPRCTAMKADGSWESLTCTERRHFMCYKQDVSSQNLSYHSVLENKTWYEAQSCCRTNYTDLVTINDQNQNETVKKEWRNSSTSFWIGLLCDDFEWVDGNPSAYRNWAKDEPRNSSNCAAMKNSGKWFTVPCTNNEFALCRNTTTINYP